VIGVTRLRVALACAICLELGFAVAWWARPAVHGSSTIPPSRAHVVFRVSMRTRLVALTFDDGPDPRYTPIVLRLLAQYHAHATFFVIGLNVQAHPDLVRAELAAHDELGDHTWDHTDLETLAPDKVQDEIERGASALRDAGAPAPKYFRPPHGYTDEAVGLLADAHKYRTIFWDLAVEHYVNHSPTVPAGVDALLARVRPGSIILAHDGGIPNRARTMQALPLLLRGLRARGYRVVDVSQLLSAGKEANAPSPPTTLHV
jgi:peptidoglycan/xylan/chitin deacetylase (PgdA/CDA1 family)